MRISYKNFIYNFPSSVGDSRLLDCKDENGGELRATCWIGTVKHNQCWIDYKGVQIGGFHSRIMLMVELVYEH